MEEDAHEERKGDVVRSMGVERGVVALDAEFLLPSSNGPGEQ